MGPSGERWALRLTCSTGCTSTAFRSASHWLPPGKSGGMYFEVKQKIYNMVQAADNYSHPARRAEAGPPAGPAALSFRSLEPARTSTNRMASCVR